MQKTKIIATIGPASESEKVLERMMKNGMDVARFNFSHGDHEWHRKIIRRVRDLSQKLGVNVGILADLQGPRIRVNVSHDLDIKRGEEILVSDIFFRKFISDVSSKIIFLDHPEIIQKLKKGNDILIEDGLIKARITGRGKNFLKAKVIDGGIIKNHKGVNIPGADLDIDVITSKDISDLRLALKEDVDFVALSFVKDGKDIEDLKKRIKKISAGKNNLPQIVAKIERKEALDNLDGILESADVIMVARGDLGIEMKESQIAVLQKKIITKSLKKACPVIVATQMLDSMIRNPRPTRAEVSDVSNAVIDHADAVMLSGESANGSYPAESVRTMKEIIQATEESPFDDIDKYLKLSVGKEYAVIVKSAYEMARSFSTKAILAISLSGFTARLVSHFRPNQRILIATNNPKTFRQFSLVWGVDAFFFEDKKLDTFIDRMIEKAKNRKKLKAGDEVIIILGRIPKGEKMRLVGVRRVK